MDEHPIGDEQPGDGQAHEVCGQDRLAAGHLGQATETEQDEEEKLDLRL